MQELNVPALLVILAGLVIVVIVGVMAVLAVKLVRQYLDSHRTTTKHEGWPVQNHPNPQQKFGMFRKK